MPEVDKKYTVSIDSDTSPAEKKYSDFIKKIEEPVKLEIDADLREAKDAIKSLQSMMHQLTSTASKDVLKINVRGIDSVYRKLEELSEKLTEVSRKISFEDIRPPKVIEAELDGLTKKIEKMQQLEDELTGSLGKSVSRSVARASITNQSDNLDVGKLSKYISLVREYISLGGDISKLDISYGFKNPKKDKTVKETTEVLDLLKEINNLAVTPEISFLESFNDADFTRTLTTVTQLTEKARELNVELAQANAKQGREFTVGLDEHSIQAIADAVEKLNGVLSDTEGKTIGIKAEDVQKITESFTSLQTVLQNIHNLLSSLDIPKIKTPEIPKEETKPRQESRQTVSKTISTPTPDGGTRTVTHTNDSSVTSGGTAAGTEAAVDAQNTLQSELRETAQEAQTAADALSKIGSQGSSDGVKRYAELLDKSFATSGKKEATTQLRETYKEVQKYLGDGGIDFGKLPRDMSDAGRAAAYSYIKAYQEAISKGVAQSTIDKNTFDDIIGKTYDAEFLELQLAGYKEVIQDFADIYAQIGNIDVTPELGEKIAEYVRQLDILREQQQDFESGSGLFDASDIQLQINYCETLKKTVLDLAAAQQKASAAHADLSGAQSAEQSAAADEQAASAATDRAAANETLAASEEHVNQAESSNDGTPITQVSDAGLNSAVSQAQSTVASGASIESASLDALIIKLGEVVTAVDAKTQAFAMEAQAVSGAVDGEIAALDALLGEVTIILNDIQKLADAIVNIPEINLKMSEVGDGSTMENVATAIGILKEALNGFDSSKLNSIKDIFGSLKISPANLKNLEALPGHIDTFNTSLSRLLSKRSGTMDIFSSINDVLAKSQELKDFATILSKTEAQRESAAKAAKASASSSTGADSDADRYKKLSDGLDQYNQKVKEYYEIQNRLVTGKSTDVDADKQKAATALRDIIKYEKEANDLEAKGVALSAEYYKAIQNRRDEEEKLASTKKQQQTIKDSRKTADSLLKSLDSRLTSAENVEVGKNPAYKNKVAELRKDYDDLATYIKSIDWSGNAESQLDVVKGRINKINSELNKANSSREFREANQNNIERVKTSMSEWMQRNSGASEYFPQIKELQNQLQQVGSMKDLDNIVQGFERIKQSANDANKVGKSFGETLKGSFKNLARYMLTFVSFQRVLSTFREAVNIVKELDTALTEMSKVSNESLSSLKNYQTQTFDMADRVGTTAKQLQDSTADWMRLGEQLSEARESAEQSNILLNVSEFDNISDATESLVAMSQAYKELGKNEIIDKLNNVGNNFSISTNQLAESLQKSSGTLKLAGNTLDEAIALTTAGNAILQDPLTVGTGLKMISLRLTGTKGAADELAAMGEDVDTMITTQSKLRQTIMDATKVQSNQFKGFDILDDNGNYKSTFQILKGISEIYEEIAEADEKYQRNNKNLLLETIAGKNRASVAAGILSDPKLLNDVYEASQNSDGSAQQELEKYLDSVEGKLAQLKNRLQELATVTISSDWLKTMIDLGTDAVKVITSLVKQFGGLSAVIGSAAGIFLQAKGFGLGAYNKQTKQWGAGGLLSAFMPGKEQKTALSGELQNFFAGKDLTREISDMTNAEILASPQEFQDYIWQCEAAGKATGNLGDAMNALKTPISGMSGALSAAANIGLNFISTLGTMAAVMAATWAVGKVIEGIYKWINAQKIAIETGKEARDVISETSKSYNETKESISSLSDEYAKLSTGVRFDNGTLKNVNLSEEEFQRYLEISGQLADLAPELVTGYTSQGQAIVNLGTTVDGVNAKLQDFLKTERDIANSKIGSGLNDVFKGITSQVDKYSSAAEIQEQKVDKTAKAAGEIGTYDINDIKQDFVTKDTKSIRFQQKDLLQLTNLVSKMPLGDYSVIDLGEGDFQLNLDLSSVEERDLQRINSFISGREQVAEREATYAEAQLKKSQIKIDAEYKTAIPYIQEYVDTTFMFDSIEEDKQDSFRQGMKDLFTKIDYASVRKDIEEMGGLEFWVDDVIATMMANDKTQNAFGGLIDLAKNRANMTYPEIAKARNKYFDQLSKEYTDENGDALYSRDDWAILFGWATKDGEDVRYNTKGRIQDAIEKMGFSKENASKFRDEINSVRAEFADTALSAIESMPQYEAKKIADNWDAFWKYIEPYMTGKNAIKDIEKSDTLSSLFGREDYQKAAESYENKLSSLTGALETIRSEGELSAEAMRDLREEFPDIGEITEESLSSTATDQLTKWVETIRNAMKDMSPEGIENANRYIEDLILSFGDLDLAIGDVRDAFVTADPTKNTSDYIWQSQDFEKKISDLKDRVGEDLNMEVVYTLIATDQFSGDADSIAQKYNDMEIKWRIILDNQEAQRSIDSLLSDRQTTSARNAVRAAQGYSLTREDYEYDNALSESLISHYNEQLANAQAKLDDPETSARAKQVARTAMQSIMQNIYAEEEHIASNNSAMRELALKPYELALEANDAEANRIDISRQQKEQRGESDFTDENNADIARLEERNETLRREGVIVNARKVLMEIANKGKEEILKTNQDYLDLQKREIEIENERAKNNIEIANLQKENEQQEITRINNERFLQKHKVNEANRAIENRQQEGRRVDESMYQDAIDETEADLRLARDAQNKLIEEKNEFEREWYGEHPNATEQDIAQNLVWQNYVEQLEAGQDDIDALKQAIKEYTDNIRNLPLDDLEAVYNQLDQYSSSLDRKMSNRRYTATPFDYLTGIATEQLKERNLEKRIAAKRSEQSGYNIEDSKYWEIQQEIDNLISAYDSAIAKQDEFANSLINIPADIVQKQLNKINEALEDLQSNQDLKLRLGFELSEEDYDANIDVNNQKILANAGMSLVSNIADGLLGGIGLKETDEFRQNVRNTGRQARSDKNQAVGDKFENEQAKEEIYLNQLQKSLTQWENDVTDIQNEISLLQAQGQQVTAEDYRALMAKNRGQLTIQEKILAENERLMGVYAGKPEIWAKYAEGAQNAENAINSLKLSQIELQDNIDQIPLTKLQNDLSDIQTKAEEINALQSSRELRGLKKNIKYYDDILDNSKEQIKNLREQNKILRQQQIGLDATNDRWREAQQQIDANNSSIRSLMDSQYQWGMEVGTLAAQNIQTTIDTLMQALSEGRLSGETLTNMIKESPNFSDALFHTTTGQYVDTKKMWAVIEQQYDYQKAMIDTQQAAEAMKFNQNEKDLLDMAKKAGIATDSVDELYNTISQAPDNPDFASMFDLFDENAQIKDTIANLQAMEEELLAASSAFGKWQSAQSTANPSDYMQTIRGGMEEAKKLYDQGWWGKDDFTTFADLIATDAQIAAGTSVDNFEKNYKAVQRYLTEDISGVNNWIKDMIDAGYALETATGFEFDVDNMEQFAAAMGRSAEFAEYMLMTLKDAGYEIDLSVLADEFANDFQSIDYMANDAGLQVKALVDEMTELANSGIDVSNSAEAAAQALKLLSETDPNFDAEDLINQLNEIGNYSGFHIDPKTFEVSYKNATKDIEDYAKDHPVELEVKVSEIHVDKQRAKEALEGYQEGGNVDLLNRPIIDPQKLVDAGFEDAGEGAATVFTTTFSNELADQHLDGGIAMNFTPILPDGTVMEARKFDQYCYDVINGVHDDYLKLQIGAEFTGEDAIEQAEKAASEIHRYQDQYYRDQYTDDVVRTFKGENAEQELANYKRALETVDEAQQNNSESLQNYVDKINEFSQEDFDNIIFGNGALEEGSAGQLETTIDGLISSLGLSQQEAIGLMQVLHDMGLIDIEPEVEVDDKEVSEAKESVEELRTEAEKPINATVEVTDTTTETPTATKTPAHVGSYEASVRRVEQEQAQTQEKKETIIQEVKFAMANDSVNPNDLLKMSEDQLATYDIHVKGIDELNVAREAIEELSAEDGFDYVVKIDQEQFEALTSSEKTTNVTVDTDAANSAIDDLNAKLESIPDGEADVNVHTADALTKIGNVRNKLNELSGMAVAPSVTVADGASSVLSGISSMLTSLNGRRATTIIETQHVTTRVSNAGGHVIEATGTAHVSHALGTAHALGTGYSLWEEYRHSKNAYARGSREDWALQQDENALVNEVGTESIVRDGKWFEIPGGAHVEQLKRGDIIFSAKQTEELKKYGKVYSGGGHGKIAYADGTAYNMINAYYDRRNSSASGSGTWHGPSSPASTPSPAPTLNNTTVNNNTAALNSNTEEQKKNNKTTKATKGSLDEFKKFVEKLHDWIEVRIERVSAAIDNFTQSAENLVGFAKKNAEVDKAMALTGTGLETYKMKTAKPDVDDVRRVTGVSFKNTVPGTQIDNNLRGANRYFAQAEKIRKQGIKNKLVNADQANEIIGLIQSGAIDISEYNEKQREFIDSYTEW